jgi:hypothetical protein
MALVGGRTRGAAQTAWGSGITSGGTLGPTGTYTKVNRCLTEDRQAFVRRLAGIQGGVECERFAPLLSESRTNRLGQAGAIDASVVAVAMEAVAVVEAIPAFAAELAASQALVPVRQDGVGVAGAATVGGDGLWRLRIGLDRRLGCGAGSRKLLRLMRDAPCS